VKTNLLLICLFLILGGCSTLNLSKTIAGGECGAVDYRIIFMGTPLLGIQAERECVKEDETL